MVSPFASLARRRRHLEVENLLRSLTGVIDAKPNGINLGQGVCDLDSPEPLRQGAIDCISGSTDRQTYTFYSGVPELREAIAKKLNEFNKIPCTPKQVAVTAGSTASFFSAGLTLFNPGDEVILFEPFYSYHHTALQILGAVQICVPLIGEEYEFDPERLRNAITPKTRGVVLNSPGNPTGKIFSREDVEAVSAVLRDTDIILLTDEVYEYMCFDGREHVSPATVPGLEDRTLTIGGFSKTYSVTGWRVGYVVGPEDIVDKIGRVFDQTDICAARPMQRGVQRALEELPPSFYTNLQADYQRMRDQFCAALADGGWKLAKPQGAYYVMADYSDVFGDLEPYPAVLQMIEQKGVNAVPGDLFYSDPRGVRNMRFHFAVTDGVLDDVCARLGER